MAVWEPANALRKAFNWFAPIASLGLVYLYVFIIQPRLYEPPLVLGIFPDLLAKIMPKPIKLATIIRICVVIAGVVLYYAVCFTPIKNDDLNIWPVDIMVIITTGMITAIGNWTGVLMFLQWAFVWFLGDDPIWELARSSTKT
ncbi:MAG: hypothetical protein ACFFDN_16090 [Candidatus Hodarchaeota archaeon]